MEESWLWLPQVVLSAQEPTPLNAAEWSSAIEIIELAKAAVEEGWYQTTAVPGTNCLATALEKGWQDSNKSLVDFNYARLAVDRAIGAGDVANLTGPDDPLATPYWGRYYMYWNDTPGRTKDDVLEALDDAIAIAETEREEAYKVHLTEDDLERFDSMMMQSLGFR